MKAFYDGRQKKHDPKNFMANGVQLPNPEVPARADVLCQGAEAAGCQILAPTNHGFGPIASVHTTEYLEFLKTIHDRWKRMPNSADEVIPNIHPDRRTVSYPKSAIGQAGYHQADTACPIGENTWGSAYWSAQSALSAADQIIKGEQSVYALCRPPGHHAFADMAGGFCFLNNTAIAADTLSKQGKRVAVLDIDVHHGNGTQGIFYNRKDVLTISIHADPIRFYPFFWGHTQERGEGEGLGANLNLPLERGSGDDDYLPTLEKAKKRIAIFGADVVLIALGLDAYEADPLKGLSITTQGFSLIGQSIKELGLPVLAIQEGGYLAPALADNLQVFLEAIQ
jgi:acetoin utilization deacetylase AcuC-like enzyme